MCQALPPLQDATLQRRMALFKSCCAAAGMAVLSRGSRARGDPVQRPSPTVPLLGSARPMPALGFGTCCRESAQGQPLIDSVKVYLASGGRLIDTAQLYGNHRDIATAIQEAGIPREELWVTSKVAVGRVKSAEDVLKAVNISLRQLGLSYLDLMLLHGGEGWGLKAEQDVAFWQGLIEAKSAGKVRNIGVSNHNQKEIEQLTAATGEMPAVNQLEYHPWVPKDTKQLVRWCQSKGIAVTAYGSLGGSANKARGEAVEAVANKYGRTSAQVLLRWALDEGVAVIPGATSASHIREDLDLNFLLRPEDARALEIAQVPQDFTRWHNCKSGCAA